jgi:hypothetical protein
MHCRRPAESFLFTDHVQNANAVGWSGAEEYSELGKALDCFELHGIFSYVSYHTRFVCFPSVSLYQLFHAFWTWSPPIPS